MIQQFSIWEQYTGLYSDLDLFYGNYGSAFSLSTYAV